jgi:hypothetical protein
MSCYRFALVLLLSVVPAGTLVAQPTYKLDVKSDLVPRAKLTLSGATMTRTDVRDDPGFRLQYHVRKDGKTVAAVNARGEHGVRLPSLDPGTYTVVLELFHPNYKGGTAIKGEFKPVSDAITYRVDAGKPPKITVVPTVKIELVGPPAPAKALEKK